MRHARSDYDHIQDLSTLPDLKQAFEDAMKLQAELPSMSGGSALQEISRKLSALLRVLHPLVSDNITSGRSTFPHDEPVFVLRAKDRTAPAIVRAWARLNAFNGVEPDARGEGAIARAARAQADRMEDYAREHYAGGKEADAPAEALRLS